MSAARPHTPGQAALSQRPRRIMMSTKSASGNTFNRRSFLRRSAVASAAVAAPMIIPSHVLGKPGRPGANDRIGLGGIGVGRRGGYITQLGQPGQPGRRRRRREPAPRQEGRREVQGRRLPGLPQTAGTQGRRRDHHGHLRPLAGAGLHPRRPGRQGYLRRKAHDADHPRRPADGRGRPQVQPRLPDRQPAAVHAEGHHRLRDGPRGPDRQDQARRWPATTRAPGPTTCPPSP